MSYSYGRIVKYPDRIKWIIDNFPQLFEIHNHFSSHYFEFENDICSFSISREFQQSLYQLSVARANRSNSEFNIRMGIQGFPEKARLKHFCRFDKYNPSVVLNVPDSEINQLQSIGDQFTFYCEICVVRDNAKDGNESKAETSLQYSQLSNSVVNLQKDLKELLLRGKDSDVTIKVKSREFQAHRLILGMRSPVFSAMFQHDTTEKKTGIVNIDDLDPDTFMDFLEFVYTGSTDLLSDNVLYLYTAADKYEVMALISECLEFMKKNLSVSNFFNIMAFSLLHSKQELMDIATNFFVKNAEEIVSTADWKVFLKENLVVGNELYIKALKARKLQ